MMASQITSLTIVYSIVYSGADQSKHQGSASLAFVWGIHRGPVNSPHKWSVTRKMFPFNDVIMIMIRPCFGQWMLKFLFYILFLLCFIFFHLNCVYMCTSIYPCDICIRIHPSSYRSLKTTTFHGFWKKQGKSEDLIAATGL